MKRKVFVIAILMIVLLVSLASIQGCGKKKTDEVKPPKKPEVTKPEEQTKETTPAAQQTVPTKKVPPDQAKLYELQVAASPSYANIVTEKNKLAQYGYETKITTTKKKGKLFYRLRLKGLYSAPEANELGKQLKAKFPSINDYWLAKVK
ncbi:MAG TPA: SPOR domain-containing protein [Candidatus Cloacimonetes bacterium]|nr:SPOR domain-containing protein [Candidatus Cloacimonadota bacterium]HHE40996.1 SPOR domain-containing protein [Candidatus Cloacimonadota bacterium]